MYTIHYTLPDFSLKSISKILKIVTSSLLQVRTVPVHAYRELYTVQYPIFFIINELFFFLNSVLDQFNRLRVECLTFIES